jgi:hypothetical protein
MAAYELDPWHDLFVMAGGASAALAGLLFVAVSLNLEHILKHRALPTMAAQSVALLIGLVVACALGLAPQPLVAVGVELLVLGVGLLVLVLATTWTARAPGDRRVWLAQRIGLGLAGVLPMVVGGASVIAGAGGGLFWMLAEIVAGLAVATFNAWVLLIEIRR